MAQVKKRKQHLRVISGDGRPVSGAQVLLDGAHAMAEYFRSRLPELAENDPWRARIEELAGAPSLSSQPSSG